MGRLNAKWEKYAAFGRFCRRTKLAVYDAAMLMQLAHAAFRAGVAECNAPGKAVAAERARRKFEAYATGPGLRCQVKWPGLMPIIVRRRVTYFLPEC